VSTAAAALEEHLLLGGAILALAAGAALASRWLRLPALITFLGLGMLLGSEGVGVVSLHDPDLARTIGTLGLIAILFEGGLATKWADVRPVVAPTCLLGTVGVVITATVTGLAALVLFDLSTVDAFLLGAVVSSTDAAAVFAALRVTRLRRRVATLLSAESGVNDPMAVALTLGFISWAVEPDYNAADITLLLARELGLGLVVGVVFGYLVTRLAPRMLQDLAAFAPIASVATAALAYGLADRVGGSGFLSVYIVALALGNTPMPLQPVILAFHEGLAFIAEAVLFIVLGLLVFPSSLSPRRIISARARRDPRVRRPAARRRLLHHRSRVREGRTRLPCLGWASWCCPDRARDVRALGAAGGKQHDLQRRLLRRDRLRARTRPDPRAPRAQAAARRRDRTPQRSAQRLTPIELAASTIA
jgi:NhaP-type Na+/H+ and K+/H+ antiporter